MSKNQKISPKLMLTQQTSDTCIFQFPSWFPTDSLVDKWHNHYMDICRCTNTFVRLVYIFKIRPVQWRIQDYREGGVLERAKRATVRGGLWGFPPENFKNLRRSNIDVQLFL